jgi:hypothetical protein
MKPNFTPPKRKILLFKSMLLVATAGKYLPQGWRNYLQRLTYKKRIKKNWSSAHEGFSPLASNARVNFMVAGAQKAGTSALIKLLGQHPQVSLPVVKEPHFFDNDGFFSGESIPIKEYHRSFPDRGPNKLYGEGTPRTMFSPESVSRVFKYNPEMKLICILRDPVERAFSAWNMNKTAGEFRSFEELVNLEIKHIEKLGPIRRGFNSYLSRGMYADQIIHLRKYFSPEQLLFVEYSYFKNNNAKVLEECVAFLGLDPLSTALDAGNTNVYTYQSALNQSTEKRLREWLSPEIERIENLLSWNLSHWKGGEPR